MARSSWLAYVPHDASPEGLAALAAGALGVIALGLHALVYVLLGPLGAGIAASVTVFGLFRWVHWNGVGVVGWRWSWLRDTSVLMSSLSSTPQQPGTLRVVCLSDTHGRHRRLPPSAIPAGDVLIHCGDFTHHGTHAEIRDFDDWLGALPHRHKLVIAGNHDLSLDAAEYDRHWDTLWRRRRPRGADDEGDDATAKTTTTTAYEDPRVSRQLLKSATYLENRSVVIDGLKIYGSPMTPPIPGRIMAFNVARGFAAQREWAKIPADVDVLVTHGPPHGILDRTFTGLHVGDESLLKEVLSRCRPRFHVFGHIHEAYGITRLGATTFINCATSTLLGQPRHRPVVFDIALPVQSTVSD